MSVLPLLSRALTRELSGADGGVSCTGIAAALLTGAVAELGGALSDPGRLVAAFAVEPLFDAGRGSAGTEAVPSFEAGATASLVGVFDASATVADEAAGGALFEAQAPSVPATKIAQYFFMILFLHRA